MSMIYTLVYLCYAMAKTSFGFKGHNKQFEHGETAAEHGQSHQNNLRSNANCLTNAANYSRSMRTETLVICVSSRNVIESVSVTSQVSLSHSKEKFRFGMLSKLRLEVISVLFMGTCMMVCYACVQTQTGFSFRDATLSCGVVRLRISVEAICSNIFLTFRASSIIFKI